MDKPGYLWQSLLDERQRKEVEFALLYSSMFAHGTTGHNQLMLIAKLASVLIEMEQKGVVIKDYVTPPDSAERGA